MSDGDSVERARRLLRTGNLGEAHVRADGLPEREPLERRIEAFVAGRGRGLSEALRREITATLSQLYDRRPARPIGGSPILEAVIIADGSRPVFFLQGDRLVESGAPTGPFVQLLRDNAAAIETASLAVGRIETDDQVPAPNLDTWFDGTAFLVADNIAITNRHVIQRMVNEPDSTEGPFTLRARYWLNFDGQAASTGRRRFKIRRVLYAGPMPIGDHSDIRKLDMAVLEIGPADSEIARPTPLPITRRRLLLEERVVVVGYPAAPKIHHGSDPPPPGSELESVLAELFDSRFGYKRCASGEIDAVAGFEGDEEMWTVKHDASTLGGNSGSPVMVVREGNLKVSALHFSGLNRRANYAHVLERLEAILTPFGVVLQD